MGEALSHDGGLNFEVNVLRDILHGSNELLPKASGSRS